MATDLEGGAGTTVISLSTQPGRLSKGTEAVACANFDPFAQNLPACLELQPPATA
jgi:hypothetical protein